MDHADSTGRTPFGKAALSRRLFMRQSLIGAAGLGLGGLLDACGSSSSNSSSTGSAGSSGSTSDSTSGTTASSGTSAAGSASKSVGDLSVQLEWIENYNWAGMYIAMTKGYYKDAGLDVTLLPGGPSVTPTTVVLGGKAAVGLAGADVVAAAVLKGAPFKIFGTQYQKSPYGIMSKASDPVKVPKDLIGRKVAVATEDVPSFDAFLAIAGVDKSKVTVVPAPDVSVPLYKSGEISASLEFFDGPLELKQAGIKPYFFNLSDFGYNIVSDAYFALDSTIEKEPDKLMALLEGDSRGWSEEIKDPSLGATLGVKVYGKSNGLVLADEIANATTQNGIIHTSETAKYGLLSLSPELQEQNIKSLAAGGLKISAAKLFDDSIVTGLYKAHPSLLSA